jgi:hypothetical protein
MCVFVQCGFPHACEQLLAECKKCEHTQSASGKSRIPGQFNHASTELKFNPEELLLNAELANITIIEDSCWTGVYCKSVHIYVWYM